MGVYTKLFQNHSNYSDYRYNDGFIRPNVSKCINESHVHYNPRIHVSGIIDTEQIATRLNRYLSTKGSIPVSGGGTVIDMAQTTSETTSKTPNLKWTYDPIVPSINCACPDCTSMYYTNVSKVIKFSDGTNVSIEYNRTMYDNNDERIGDAYYLNYPMMLYDEDNKVYVDIDMDNIVHSETHEGKEYIYLNYYQSSYSSGKTSWVPTNFVYPYFLNLIILDNGTYVLEINPHNSELNPSECPPLQLFEHFPKMTIEYRNVCGYDRSNSIYYDNIPVLVLHVHPNYQPLSKPPEPTEEEILAYCEEYRTSYWDVDENIEIKNVVSTPIIGNKYVSGLDVSNYFREILIDGVDKKDEIVSQEGSYQFEPGLHSIDYVLNTGYKIRPETFAGVTFLDNVSITKKITNIREEAFDFCQLVGTDEDTIRRICSVDDVEPIVVETEFDGPVLYNLGYSGGNIDISDRKINETKSLKATINSSSSQNISNVTGVFYSDSEGYNQYYALMEGSTGYVVGDKLCIGYIPKFNPYEGGELT